MSLQRLIVGASTLLVLVASTGCGGVTPFSGDRPFTIVGNAPPPPPPPPAPPPPPPAPPARVELRDNKIEFKEKIQFDVNKATIKPESFGLLKEIADVIKKNPQVKHISIEGHASAEGDAKANKKLSDDRAKAVMKHLVDKEQIPAGELTAKGWGVEKPIADNATEAGREANRRVEFLVTDAEVTSKKVEIDPKTGKEKIVEEKKEEVKSDSGTPATPAAGTAKPAAGTAKPAAGTTAKPATPAPKPTPEKKP